jgi:non-ribosomal peptide synthetase component E (peptide arylation enzyme)
VKGLGTKPWVSGKIYLVLFEKNRILLCVVRGDSRAGAHLAPDSLLERKERELVRLAKPTRYTPEMFKEYRKKGYWESATLSDFWNRNGKEYPDREAVVDSRTRLTWGQANQWIDRLALGFLELGLTRDELIVVQLPNSVELCLLRVACERAGLLCLPVLRTWRQREMAYVLDRVKAAGVVIPWTFRGFDHFEMVEEIRPRLPKLKHVFVVGDRVPENAISIKRMAERPLEKDHPEDYSERTKCRDDEFSLIAATTGTTGFPKFVESPICSRIYMGKVFIEKFGLTDEDVIGVLSPSVGGPNHQAYFCAPMLPVKVVMLEHFSPDEAFRLIEKEEITFAGVVPAQLAMMMRAPEREAYDLGSLRLFHCAGAPLPPQLGMEVEEKLGCPIVQSYGAMDSGGMTLHSSRDNAEVRLFTIGKPAPGSEVRLVDDAGQDVPEGDAGEILVRGPVLISGYYNDPEATWLVWTKDGWYQTGDLGNYDECGNLLIVGRKKDIIIRGGQNIYPVEIENLLMTHPNVANIAVVKMPDPVMGERACAYLVPKKGQSFTFEEMVSFLREKNIAAYKWPERMEIVHALPMVAEGQKVDKKMLEKDIEEKLKGE